MDVRFLGVAFNRDAFDDRQTISFNPDDLSRVIRHETDPSESQADQDLRTDTIVAQVRFKTQLEIGLDGIAALILELIGLDFIQQPDAPPLLAATALFWL